MLKGRGAPVPPRSPQSCRTHDGGGRRLSSAVTHAAGACMVLGGASWVGRSSPSPSSRAFRARDPRSSLAQGRQKYRYAHVSIVLTTPLYRIAGAIVKLETSRTTIRTSMAQRSFDEPLSFGLNGGVRPPAHPDHPQQAYASDNRDGNDWSLR